MGLSVSGRFFLSPRVSPSHAPFFTALYSTSLLLWLDPFVIVTTSSRTNAGVWKVFFPRTCISCQSWSYDWQIRYNMIDRKYTYEGKTLCRLIFTTCYSYLSSVFLPKLLGIISWNYKENVLWQSLACFVIGGIITVIFIKLLEWQRDYNKEEQEEKRILVPVQEVGDGDREEPMEIRKFPREQDDF